MALLHRSSRLECLVDQTGKLEPFLVSMSLLAHAKDVAIGRIQREQSGCAPSFVVMRHGGAASALQQAGLGTIQSLNFALFVNAQHQRVLRPVQVQTDNVFQFFRELEIVTELKRFHAMRLEPVGPPDPPHAGFAHADCRLVSARETTHSATKEMATRSAYRKRCLKPQSRL